jgi:hypothetical protein
LSQNGLAKTCPEDQALADQKMLEGGQSVVSTQMQANGHKWVKAKILIKAPPHVVWETVHEERKHDPELSYSKMLSHDHDEATLEQKFCVIPVIGTAVCMMKNVEVPDQRIDYSMLSSDRFKAFEGSWVLTPGADANSTYLELSSYSDIGLPVPRPLIEGVTAKKLQRRLSNVKNMAEAMQTRLAHATKPEIEVPTIAASEPAK